MKNLKFYIPVIALLSLVACKKSFLDTEDVTSATEQNFYKTTDDAWKALVGVYDGMQRAGSSGSGLQVIAAEVLSDNTFGGTGNADGFGYKMMDEFDKLASPSDQDMFGDNWNVYYKAIYRANMLLSHLDQVNWKGNTALRKVYESETRFIRAFLYFDMVRFWGNIPLITKPTAENVPQASPDSVYRLIAEDLKFAAANLPSTNYGAQAVSTHGRVTKWAAESLIGRVFLYYTGYYNKTDLVGSVNKAQALAYLEDVISNGGFGLVSSFANLWPVSLNNYVGEDNKETVFAIKYTYTSDWNGNVDGNHWMVMAGIRVQSIYPYGMGWGACTVNPKLWNAYDANDTRRNATIISIADENLDFQNKKDQREYTGYYLKKYTPLADATGKSLAEKMGGVSFMISQFQDFVAIRYSDVLLMAAELGSSNAQKYFDDVRKRAFGANFVQVPVTQANIMKERRFEFAGEGIRYWDLLRQGISTAASTIAETATVENGGVSTTKTISAANITKTKGLQQIPNSQITLSSGTLKQNEGW